MKHASSPGPLYFLTCLARNRQIVLQMARRDILERYRGSALGLAWSLFNPLLMMLIYTFVFSVVLGTRWPGSSGGSGEYAINLFAGMIAFSLFSESLARAPTLVVHQSNLVKKVVFPVEILPWVTMVSSLFHAAVSFAVLLLFVLALKGSLHAASLLFPLLMVPVVLLALGLSWIISSFGVFFRDMTHTVGLAVTALMFMSPVFYPLAAVPEPARAVLAWNPLARPIEESRAAAVLGAVPEIGPYLALVAVGALVAWAGLRWFMYTKRSFADVL